MNPATREWTCPNCGNPNGPPAPAHAGPAHATPARTAGPSMQGRGPLLAIAAGVIVVLIAVWFIFFRSSEPTAAVSATDAVSPTVVDTLAHLCADVAADMPLRVDSVTRTEQAVRADAKTLKQEGNAPAAKAATTLANALASLSDALAKHGDTLTANQAVQTALAELPC